MYHIAWHSIAILVLFFMGSIAGFGMIKTFRCKETKKIWEGYLSKKYPVNIQERALKKLRQLDVAFDFSDLKNPPGNNLEHLKGDRKGQMSIRINQQWRLCFIWRDNNAYEVEIVDYH